MATVRGEAKLSAPRVDEPGEHTAHIRERLRAVVLLGGGVRATSLSAAIGRSVLDLPVEDDRSILDLWRREAKILAERIDLDELSVHVMINRGSVHPTPSPTANGVRMTVEEDASAYRGTAGVLRDMTEEFDDDDCILVANGAQIMVEPLADLCIAMVDMDADVCLVCHDDGTPGGVMWLRSRVLKTVSRIGFVDLKEQALPLIAAEHRVAIMHRTEPTGLSVRTLSDYINALRWHHRRDQGPHQRSGAFAEAWRPTFGIVEEGAVLGDEVRVHDSVVLGGAHVERGAVLVQSLVCPDGTVARRRILTDRLVTAAQSRKPHRGSP